MIIKTMERETFLEKKNERFSNFKYTDYTGESNDGLRRSHSYTEYGYFLLNGSKGREVDGGFIYDVEIVEIMRVAKRYNPVPAICESSSEYDVIDLIQKLHPHIVSDFEINGISTKDLVIYVKECGGFYKPSFTISGVKKVDNTARLMCMLTDSFTSKDSADEFVKNNPSVSFIIYAVTKCNTQISPILNRFSDLLLCVPFNSTDEHKKEVLAFIEDDVNNLLPEIDRDAIKDALLSHKIDSSVIKECISDRKFVLKHEDADIGALIVSSYPELKEDLVKAILGYSFKKDDYELLGVPVNYRVISLKECDASDVFALIENNRIRDIIENGEYMNLIKDDIALLKAVLEATIRDSIRYTAYLSKNNGHISLKSFCDKFDIDYIYAKEVIVKIKDEFTLGGNKKELNNLNEMSKEICSK